MVCRGLWKLYGSAVALKDVSFELKGGDFCLVAGPNGAGKTTLMRVLSGVTQPSWGEAYVGGVSVRSTAVRDMVGYLPEEAGVLGGLSVWRNTILYARLSGYSGEEAERRARRALVLMGLWELRGRRAGALSRGLARRLILAQLLTRDSEVLLLDEPAAGLDVVSSIELRRFVRGLADHGKAVLYTTHHVHEVDELADKVLLISGGSVRYFGSSASFMKLSGSSIRILYSPPSERFIRELAERGLEVEGERGRAVVRCSMPLSKALHEVADAAASAGVRLDRVEAGAERMEELVLKVISGA